MNMNPTSDTPVTDAATFLINDGKRAVVGVETGKKLERQLTDARLTLQRLARPFFAGEHATLADENTRLRAENAALLAALEAMKAEAKKDDAEIRKFGARHNQHENERTKTETDPQAMR